MDDDANLLAVLLIALIIAMAWWRYDHSKKEKYGPPPGMARAISHKELGYRGWPEANNSYQGSSASSVAHMVERSA